MRELILKTMMGTLSGDEPKAYTVAQMAQLLIKQGHIDVDRGPSVREAMTQAAFFGLVRIAPNGRFSVTDKGREFVYGKMATMVTQPPVKRRRGRPKKRRAANG